MQPVNRVKVLAAYIRINIKVCTCAALLAQLVVSPYVLAGPAGGNIVGGTGNINHAGLTTNINQQSNRLAIDWQSFNVDRSETVNFNQPGRSSIALNRILDQNPSQIHGAINANGQIVLVNPNGVFFGKEATVNAGGLFAAALDIDPQDFMAGRLNFTALENSTGLIVNEGRLQVIDGGTLALLGQQVKNEGLLVANFGTVALAAGSDIKVSFDEYENLSIRIDQGRLASILQLDDPAILNSGLIQSHGGRVVLTAKQADAIQSSITGINENDRFSKVIVKDGVVYFTGADGDISDLGVIDVSSESGDAGTVIYDAKNIHHSGSINADSQNGDGGTVEFNATDTTLLTENSTVSAQSHQNGKGGTVHVLGNHVGLIDHASINASGANAGGEVLIGGGYQGNNPDIKNAEAVYLGENTIISADAKDSGDGGKVIVWSDEATRAYGRLSATGGEQKGDGGFIETSSHNYVDLAPTVDVHAANGHHGEWLIDPSNITISTSATSDLSAGPLFTSFPVIVAPVNSNLRLSELLAALSTGANVIVRTASCVGVLCPIVDSQPAGGDITLANTLNLDLLAGSGMTDADATGLSRLTLEADNNININANIIESGGDDYLNLTLTANGIVAINGGINVNLSGGDLTITANGLINNGTITTENPANLGVPAGNISINVSGTANIGNLTTDGDGGTLSVTANSISGGELNIAGTTTLVSTLSIDLNDVNNNFQGVVTASGTGITLRDNDSITLGNISNGNNSLTVTANQNIIQAGGTTINTNGASTFTATTGSITLDNPNTNLGASVVLNSGTSTSITDIDAAGIQLAVSNIGTNLSVTASGDITDIDAINVTGTSTFTVPVGRSILLDNNNTFNSTMTFLTSGIGNIDNLHVRNLSNFTLNDITVDGFLTVSSNGNLSLNDITMTDPTEVLTLTSTGGDINQIAAGNSALDHSAAGATLLSATGDVNLNAQANNFSNVTISAANTANINNGTNAIVLDGVNSTNLNITATGGITDGNALVVTGTATLDAGTNDIDLDNGANDLFDVMVTNANSVRISDQTDIDISGLMSSLVLFAGINNSPATIGNVANNALVVSGSTSLFFADDGVVNLTNGGVQSDLQSVLAIGSFAGDITAVTINNISGLQLDTLADANAGVGALNLSSDTSITQTGVSNITVDGTATLQANNINLLNNIDFTGVVNINDSGLVNINDNAGGINIVANNSSTIDLTVTATGTIDVAGDLLNMNATTTGGGINSTAALNVANNTTLDAGAAGDINFRDNPVDFENLNITQANNVQITDADNLTVTNAIINGALDIIVGTDAIVNGTINSLIVNATNTISLSGAMGSVDASTTADIQNGAGALSVTGATTLAANTNISLSNAGNNFNTLGITNAQNATLFDANSLTLQDVSVVDLIITTIGDLNQSAGTTVIVSGNTSIDAGVANVNLIENNQLTNLSLMANQATVVNDQALVLNDSTLADSLTLTTNNGDLSINNITATNNINLNTAGALLDANVDSVNLIAQKATLQAVNGIGVADASIDTQLANLEAHNTASGDINIKNTGGDITLDSITNDAIDTGNFNFETTNNVFIDQIALQQNLTEEFFPNGTGTVNMFSAEGSFLGVGDVDINNADITATNLRLIGVKGTLGTIQRPLVLNISGKVELLMRASLSPIYTPPAPATEDIQDNSILQFTSADTLSAVNGIQTTEVETLLDISPAIFTDIRHFVADAEPVLLPRDQLFDNGYDEEDDEEYFRRLEGKKE